MEIPKLVIKKYRGTRGIEGSGFTYDLYVNGVLSCHVSNWGDGGPTNYRWVNDKLRDLTLAYAASLPEGNFDCMMEDLEVDHRLAVKVAKTCKTRTVFTLPSDPKGTFRIYKIPYTSGVREMVLAKYPNATILNS